MFTISCFADEISNDFDEQLDFMEAHKINYMSLRNAFGKNVLKLTDDEINIISQKLKKRGLHVSSIGSPIGKSDITDNSEEYLCQTERAIEISKMLDCKRIRIFSFYINGELDKYRDEVIRRSKAMTQLAEKAGITLINENEARIYGEKSERVVDLLESVNSLNYRTAIDPSNYNVADEKPFDESFPRVSKYIDYVHIKDSDAKKGIVPAGDGEGQIPQILNALRDKDLFLTLEPHLAYAGKMKGFSGPERFDLAYNKLISILDNLNIKYN